MGIESSKLKIIISPCVACIQKVFINFDAERQMFKCCYCHLRTKDFLPRDQSYRYTELRKTHSCYF